ncbi:hypothetical protein O181_047783 [Austropuccinia psidii MF-1]|uniref:Uncharacterized protein n=1 Tax=Austropuccinia psidii MF-1 TaxID=1389203 RepID=A0A9Q3DUK8_9BASI|nr:hypothetical protein [Austropuccinia psidii MF-1]
MEEPSQINEPQGRDEGTPPSPQQSRSSRNYNSKAISSSTPKSSLVAQRRRKVAQGEKRFSQPRTKESGPLMNKVINLVHEVHKIKQ